MWLLHGGYDYRMFGGRDRVEPEVIEGENNTWYNVSEEGTGLSRRWAKERIIRGITYWRKGPGWTGGDRRGVLILFYWSMLEWLFMISGIWIWLFMISELRMLICMAPSICIWLFMISGIWIWLFMISELWMLIGMTPSVCIWLFMISGSVCT